MELTGKSLKDEYSTPEEALRWALIRMAEGCGLSRYELAPQLDMSPSHFSKAVNPNKSEDDAERRHHFPSDRVLRYTLRTKNGTWLFTFLDCIGIDWTRLHEIRRQVKTKEQIEEERNLKLDRILKEVGELRLEMQEPGQVRKPARRR